MTPKIIKNYYYNANRDIILTVFNFTLAFLTYLLTRRVIDANLSTVYFCAIAMPLLILWYLCVYLLDLSVGDILKRKGSHLTIGDNVIKYTTGRISRRTTVVAIDKISVCTCEYDFLQKACGTATIKISAAGHKNAIYIHGIKNGEEACEQIQGLMEKNDYLQ